MELAPVKQLISQGNLEEGYEQLVKLLESSEKYAELANIARINQGDLYQLKSQNLKGTISGDEARRATNQLADNALKIVRLLESGKVSFESEIPPNSSKAWRYYVIGGVGALVVAAVLWFVFFNPSDECPAFSEEAETRVMILPFLGADKKNDPAIDIMDEMNDWIEETPELRVKTLADVHRRYDIDQEYPNSTEAVEIARNCNAQMLVWGKVRGQTLDVRYRLLDAGGVRLAGDTIISRLLSVTEEAGLSSDAKAVSRLLYMVLANYKRTPIAAGAMHAMDESLAALKDSGNEEMSVDTSTSFIMADHYILKNEPEKAIAVYSKVLEVYPDNPTAHLKRGALLLQSANYRAAARDLEAVPSESKTTNPALREARIKAFLGSSQPEKAKQEVETAKKEGNIDSTWLEQKTIQVKDSTTALQSRRDNMERIVAKSKNNLDARLGAATANLGLGDATSAETQAKEVLRRDPKNVEAVQIAVEAQLQKGDTAKAIQTIKSAERSGADLKTLKTQTILRAIRPAAGQ
ncbi:MAG: tetratricopeptide repeat protein [Lewinellaceae bacterium]|nr:tetratricopeptide repeat protein [Lewinellaceae bacterium]